MPVAFRPLRVSAAALLLPLLLPACVDDGYGYGGRGYYAEPAPVYYESRPTIILREERLREERFREERLREERIREERRHEEDRRREEDRRCAEERHAPPPQTRVENRPQQQQPQARSSEQREQRNQPRSASECGQRYGAADCQRR